MLDGKDIKTLNIPWLRSHLGVVSHEPVLFSGSVENNIKIGIHSATHEEVTKAATLANAHEFIRKMPEVGSAIFG